MSSLRHFITFVVVLFAMVGCSSAQKQREAQRKELSNSSGFYCEFLNGDKYPDIDVALNIELATKCDAGKNFSITNFKNSADNYGVVYCCAMAAKKDEKKSNDNKSELKPESKPAAPVKPDAKAKSPQAEKQTKDAGDILPE